MEIIILVIVGIIALLFFTRCKKKPDPVDPDDPIDPIDPDDPEDPIDPIDPEDPPEYPKHKYFHFDALGIFLDILEHEDFDRVEEVIERAASYGCSACSFFMWLDDHKPEHANLRNKIPWRVVAGKCDFDQPDNDWYWPLYVRFLKILKKYGMQPLPQAFMWKYNFYHFEHNKNGVASFFDYEALKHQKWMAWRTLIEQERLGITPRFKPINESNHRGYCEGPGRGHWIANWHKNIYNYVKDMVRLEDLVIDIHGSEFASAQLVWHSGAHATCSKPNCSYEWDNIKENNRKPLREQHGCSIVTDLEDEHKSLSKFINNLHNWQVKYSEDGSKHGNQVPIPGMSWRQGDANQVDAMARKAWSACKASPRLKEFYWGIHPKECLKKVDGVFVDWWDVNIIDWDRFAKPDQAHREIFPS